MSLLKLKDMPLFEKDPNHKPFENSSYEKLGGS